MKFLFTKEAKLLLLFFLTWRLILLWATAIAPIIISDFHQSFPYLNEAILSWGLPNIIWPFANFDGVHYVRLARDGYIHQFTQAFFPLYPILINLLSKLTFGSLIIAGIVISNTSFLVSIFVFYKLLLRYFNEKIAYWSCLFLIFFPTSFFFAAVYTESLFFLLLVSSFYFTSQKKYLIASVFGAFASATKLVGVLLAIALVKKRNILPLLIIPLGLIIYMIFLKIKINDPLAFISSQGAFGQNRSTGHLILLPQVFYRYLKILITAHGTSLFNAILELISIIGVIIALLVAFYKKMPRDWLIFSTLSVLLPTLTGTFISMPRYILVVFPIFIVLASIKQTWIKITILSGFITLLLLLTVMFTRGYWVA